MKPSFIIAVIAISFNGLQLVEAGWPECSLWKSTEPCVEACPDTGCAEECRPALFRGKLLAHSRDWWKNVCRSSDHCDLCVDSCLEPDVQESCHNMLEPAVELPPAPHTEPVTDQPFPLPLPYAQRRHSIVEDAPAPLLKPAPKMTNTLEAKDFLLPRSVR